MDGDDDQIAKIFCDLLLESLRAEDIAQAAYDKFQKACQEIRGEEATLLTTAQADYKVEIALSEEDKARLARLNAEMAQAEAKAAQVKTAWARIKAGVGSIRAARAHNKAHAARRKA